MVHACRLNGASVITVLADLSRPEGVELVARNAQQHGVVDIVVHAAAVYDALTFDFGKDKGQGPLDGEQAVALLHAACVHMCKCAAAMLPQHALIQCTQPGGAFYLHFSRMLGTVPEAKW